MFGTSIFPRPRKKLAIRDQTKEHIFETVKRAFLGIDLSKQSDLHVYFGPCPASFWRNTRSRFFDLLQLALDVRYGFQLQRWRQLPVSGDHRERGRAVV